MNRFFLKSALVFMAVLSIPGTAKLAVADDTKREPTFPLPCELSTYSLDWRFNQNLHPVPDDNYAFALYSVFIYQFGASGVERQTLKWSGDYLKDVDRKCDNHLDYSQLPQECKTLIDGVRDTATQELRKLIRIGVCTAGSE